MPEDINQSISDIKRLIETLNELHGKLDGASNAARGLSELITQLAQVSEGTRGLERLAQQAQKVTQAIESGTGGRIRMGEFGRLSLNRLVQKAGIEPQGNVQDIMDRMAAAPVSPESRLVGAGGGKGLDEFKAKLESLGLTADAITKILERVGQTATDLSVKSREGSKGFDTITIGFRNSSGVASQFSERIDRVTRSLLEMGQAAGTRTTNPLTQLARDLEQAGLSLEQRRGMFKEIQRLVDPSQIKGIGRVSVTPGINVEGVEGEFTKLSASIKVGENAFIPFNTIVTKTGEVLNELPKAVKASSVSLADLNTALNGNTAYSDKALAAANKYGFGIDKLREVNTEASTGIARLNFAMNDQAGVTQRLTLFVDRFGNVLTDTQKRFRGFAEGIIRNTAEAFKWLVAIQLTYAPLRKLQELVELAIKNEAELANIGVILGKSQGELGDVFNAAAQAAAATGENISGVLEGYVQAFRATGAIREETERAAVAQQLLVDSLVLSKLSALDQAGAMDTLVGALNQVGLGLDQGVILMDKWVAVSKIANVDTATLAESFAITSTSARNAGVSFDELNGIIAAVAETTTLSATEAGNAVRAFISGFQTQKAQDTLSQFGIAVKTSTGEARGFFEVMEDIAGLKVEGLIDDAQLNRIGEALGGGARRGAQYVAFIENLGRVQEVAAVSAAAQGDAYEAIDIQLETAQTKITELSNAFQVLAQTLGDEGGVLSIFKLVLEAAQGIVSVITQMTKALGGLTPVLATLGGVLAYAGATGRLQGGPGGGLYQRFGNFASRLPGAGALAGSLPGQAQTFPGTQMLMGTWATGGNQIANRLAANAPLIGTALAEALWAGTNALQGDWNGLFGQLLGGAFGAVAGGPYGALIGSTIGETLFSYLLSRSGDFQSLLVPTTPQPQETSPEGETATERINRQQEDLTARIIDAAGGDLVANLEAFGIRVGNALEDAFNIEGEREGRFPVEIKTEDIDGASAALLILKRRLSEIESGREISAILGAETDPQKIRDLIAEIERLKQAQDAVSKGLEPEGVQASAFIKESKEVAIEYGDVLRTQISTYQRDFFDQLSRGDITAKQYNESLENISNNGLLIAQVFTAVKDVMGDNEDAFTRVADVLVSGSKDQIESILQLKSEVSTLSDQLKELDGLDPKLDQKFKATNAALQETQQELAAVISGIYEINRATEIQGALQSPITVDVASIEDFNRVVAEAMSLSREQIQEQIKLGLLPDGATVDEVLATFEEIFIKIGEIGYQTLKIDPAFLKAAADSLEAAGQISAAPKPGGLTVKEFDTTEATFLAAYNKQLEFLKREFGDRFVPNLQEIGAIFTDGTDVLHLDNLVMQLAMQELIDVSKKQLEGVYNLPADSSFFVPFQGYRLGFDEQGGGGMGGAAQGLNEAANELKGAALSLKNAAPVYSDFRQRPELGVHAAAQQSGMIPAQLDPLEEIRRYRALQAERASQSTIQKKVDEMVPSTAGEPGLFERTFGGFLDTFERIFESFLNLFPGMGQQTPGTSGSLDTSQFNTVLDQLGQKVQSVGEVQTNLNINSTTQVQLLVDGRMLAQIIKPYFYEDMLRFEATAGSVTKSIVV